MINNFSLSASNLPYFIAKLNDLDLSQGYVANVKLRQSTRTGDQNSLYWKFVEGFGNHFGYDKDFTHDLLRFKFLFEIVTIDGEQHKRLLSTTKLTTKEMTDYIENCMRYGAENGYLFETV
jgi:hypothetical protein